MEFDYRKLRGKIVEKFATNAMFAKTMGWSERTLSLKLNGKVYWKQDEMCKAIKILDLTQKDIEPYFFTLKVQNIEHKTC